MGRLRNFEQVPIFLLCDIQEKIFAISFMLMSKKKYVKDKLGFFIGKGYFFTTTY